MIMNRTSSAPLGMIFLSDNIIHVDSAIIEEVVVDTAKTGYLVITIGESDENNIIYMQEIRLNIGENTIIIDENGISLNLDDLNEGMRIDADFSSAMTRSIPPQSSAYRIVVLEEETSVNITTDRVVSVDTNHGFLLTGNPNDMYDQMIFTISDQTVILDQDNDTISLEDIQPGQLVRVEHAMFQTLSIPPQSPAYRVQVL
jgi:hypothetical protein